MTEGPDVPFLDDCGHDDWKEVNYAKSSYDEITWSRCRVCGLYRTVRIDELKNEMRVVYWRERQ